MTALPAVGRAHDWLFPDAVDERARWVRLSLAALVGLRVALGPYRALAGQPEGLFRPLGIAQLFDRMPSATVVVALQAVGVVAAVVAVAARRREGVDRAAFVVAWVALLLLGSLRSSVGKILHNDVLLLLAAVPFLLARPRAVWPLRVALVTVSIAYFFAGATKLRSSGLAWVTTDNVRFLMYAASRSGRPEWPSIARYVADHAWMSKLSAFYILGVEVAFPAAVFWRWTRPLFAIAAVFLHVATWFTLGIDYWLWAAVAPLVLVGAWRLTPARR
ncbi:MAG TPA: hypothetical protein VF230_17000 [Acidimicrobiales bacterium]